MRRLVCLLLLALSSALANPSAFPETAVYGRVGLGGGVAGLVGAEVLLDTPYLDTSLGGTLHGATGGRFGLRLYGLALVFPALGTTPPLALGLGADVGLGQGLSAHVGPVVGSDLWFALRVPVTLSLYLAPGYAAGSGVSLAWSFQARYYLDDLALELESSDLALVAVGVRYTF